MTIETGWAVHIAEILKNTPIRVMTIRWPRDLAKRPGGWQPPWEKWIYTTRAHERYRLGNKIKKKQQFREEWKPLGWWHHS